MLFQQNQPRIESKQVLTIPVAVIVALVSKGSFVPAGKTIAHKQVQFKMHMGAVFGDALMRVGGTAHNGNNFPGLDRLAYSQSGPHFVQMSVERIDFHAFNDMTEDNIIAVVRKTRMRAEVGYGAIGSGHDR